MGFPAGQAISSQYEILEQIGVGSFAHVYRARDLASGHLVAIKVLKESVRGDADIVERFRREILAMSSIESAHVVAVRDFGFHQEQSYLAMELVVGTSLRSILNAATWTPRDAYVIVGQIAQALSASHAKSITHRDLKPENVMLALAEDGTQSVKVVDFGLVKIHELDPSMAALSVVGMVYGTPHYLSPEVIYGDPAGPGVDLFALTIIAYELVARRRPWNAPKTADVIRAIATEPVPEITVVAPTLERRLPEINAFFANALAKDAAARPKDAAELFLAFGRALFGDELGCPAGGEFVEVTQETVTVSALRSNGKGGAEVVIEADFDATKTVADPVEPTSNERLSAGWIESLAPTRSAATPLAPDLLEEAAKELGTGMYARYPTPQVAPGIVVAAVLISLLMLALGFLIGTRVGPLW